MQARLRQLGAEPMVMTPVELEKFIAADCQKWARVVKVANIKSD
jgi:tripartite-type tricarboxylate transporter receptor subunit TctC